jgi:hypothetical protein
MSARAALLPNLIRRVCVFRPTFTAIRSLLPTLGLMWQQSPMRLALLSLLFFISACTGRTVEKLTAGGETYVIPSGQVTKVTREPHTFIRVTDEDIPFELVFDSRLQGKSDPNGAPVVFSINDGNFPGVQYHQTGVGMMVCRRAANARGACGYQLLNGENEWSLIIPRGRLGEADQMAKDASSLLESYTRTSS